MTLEMGRVETQAQESPRAAAQEAVATAVAQVSAQARPVESSEARCSTSWSCQVSFTTLP